MEGQTFAPGEDSRAIHSISHLYEGHAGPPEIPPSLLQGPPPDLTQRMVNFEPHIPEYKDMWAVVLDGVLSGEECEELLAIAERTSHWKNALVNIGGGRQAYYSDARNCGRIIVDSRELAAKIWKRVEAAMPDILRLEDWPSVTGFGPQKREEVWKVSRLNERMRFLKYVGGEYFRAHCDGIYETDDRTERSYFTLHLYLNGGAAGEDGEPLEGGATRFFGYGMESCLDVEPKPGRVLIFQQRGLMHSGEDVMKGEKYTLRTDILYKREES